MQCQAKVAALEQEVFRKAQSNASLEFQVQEMISAAQISIPNGGFTGFGPV